MASIALTSWDKVYLSSQFQTSPHLSLPFCLLFPPPFVLCLSVFALQVHRRERKRDMFALSLTRRGRQKASNHNEQICSCKLTPTEGNAGCLLAYTGRETGIWKLCCDHMWPPFLQHLYFFHVCTLTTVTDAILAACTVTFKKQSSWVKQTLITIIHSV